MIVRKTDRRTVMTKGMIQDALLELLQNTPYEKITVTALCKQSEITRATFYLHYNNIDDVLEELLVWGDRIFEKCGIGRDEGGDGGKTLEIRGKRRLSARDGGANYQQS